MSEQVLYVQVPGGPKPVRCYKAVSAVADFENKTWTFEIDDETRVGAGDYLLVSCADLLRCVGRHADESTETPEGCNK